MSSPARQIRLSPDTVDRLRCPRCRGRLRVEAEQMTCVDGACGTVFPVTEDGIPVLIDETTSVFRIDEILESEPFFSRGGRVVELSKKLLPGMSRDFCARQNLGRFRDLLFARTATPRVLVIGAGSVLADGMELLVDERIDLVETDVSIGLRTQLVLDAHSIPFEDGSFDGVIAQAVLEHVADPMAVVSEVHRVLGSSGLVYAETPFMQQVHGGAYDFLRFTHLGHRRLFRDFTEVDSGAVAGPGTALGWTWEYFLAAFVTNLRLRPFVRALARLTGWPLKHFDRLLLGRPGALDAASATYFLGERSETRLSDRELVALYRGVNPVPRKRVRTDRALSSRWIGRG